MGLKLHDLVYVSFCHNAKLGKLVIFACSTATIYVFSALTYSLSATPSWLSNR